MKTITNGASNINANAANGIVQIGSSFLISGIVVANKRIAKNNPTITLVMQYSLIEQHNKPLKAKRMTNETIKAA